MDNLDPGYKGSLGIKLVLGMKLVSPLYIPLLYDEAVCSIVLLINTVSAIGEELEDYPDSPGTPPMISGEAASCLLDADDSTMDTAGTTTGKPSATATTCDRESAQKRQYSEGCQYNEPLAMPSSPNLPPIYYSVQRKKLNKTVVRHLDGGANPATEGTNTGAPVGSLNSIGSFANSGDKRHNCTAHRFDHAALRNISMSFDPSTLTCKSCQGAHPVLSRSIEGTDVGQDNPPVFVLVDQNFPSMVLVRGEGECIKIVQVENGSLTELVEVFLGLTRGFDMLAGAVVLLSSPSYAAVVGTADYAAEFVRSSGQLRNAFMGGVTVLHGIPFLIGGTNNTAAIRALAEIEHWVSTTSVGTDKISATRKLFMDSLCTSNSTTDVQHIIRLPMSQTSQEKSTFITTGFNNLKSAVEPISEEEEKALLVLLLEELNNLYPMNLCTDVICDRSTDEDVFDDGTKDRTDLVLIGASHLAKTARCLNPDHWNIFDLTQPGLRINSASVSEMMNKVKDLSSQIDIDKATIILQLFDNSVYMVGGPGGEKRLPGRDRLGTYHIDSSLVVADKVAIKDLVSQLAPLLKTLGGSRKIVLTPMARYWVAPCCGDPLHLVNYHTTGYLPKLGDRIAALRDAIRDALFVKKAQNFRVLCPNKMVGVGQRRQEPTDEEAAKTAALWGPDPVHPTGAAYRLIADALESDIENPDSRYTNPGKLAPLFKKPRYDPSLHRDGWVSGCSAALPRRDSGTQKLAVRGTGWPPTNRGHQGRYSGRSFGGRSSGGSTRGTFRGGGYRKFHGGRRGSP